MLVLAVNAGSSSLKLALVDEQDRVLERRELPAGEQGVEEQALRTALGSRLAEAEAVGHRIVHGGPRHQSAVVLDASVRAELQELVPLAPLHQPRALAAAETVSALLPAAPAVACFDTAFHRTLPASASTYALPASWRERWGLRRYGFHGLSHAWIARRLPVLAGAGAGELRIVSCHLGSGASLCAIAGGRSLDTTMGFTPVEGLVMATRPGSVDPGMLAWLTASGRLTPAELGDGLEHGSGLLALAGTPDMREVLWRAQAGEEAAALALDVYVHRLASSIAAMACSLGGLDAIAFTGGVGEGSPDVRRRAAERLAFLGVEIEDERNAGVHQTAELTGASAGVRTFVITAGEEPEIARETRAALAAR